MESLLNYVPRDRRLALLHGTALPERALGAALFADISGFTPTTEALTRALGPHRGAEELMVILNEICTALVAEVDRYGGSVLGFSGDAITCWFDAALTPDVLSSGIDTKTAAEPDLAAAALRASACALALQEVMASQQATVVPGGLELRLRLKTSVVAGQARRMLVGDPSIQKIETIGGSAIVRLGAVAGLTRTGETVIDQLTVDLLADAAVVSSWRDLADGSRCARLEQLAVAVPGTPWPAIPAGSLDSVTLRPWLLPPIYARLRSGLGEFLTELRHTVSLFLRFSDLDYDNDPAAGPRLDAFVSWVQQVLARYQGWLIQLSMGDKGSYLYATFGAPIAYGDDTVRAVGAALTLRTPPAELAYAGPLQIGLSGGQSRVGAMGGDTRTYNVMGDATIVAARLMEATSPGQVLMSANLVSAVGSRFRLEQLAPLALKGKSERIPVVVVTHADDSLTCEEPQYATPLVGRVSELAVIDQTIARARSAGQVLNIIGEAGIGKSRLVAESMRRARAAGFGVLLGAGQATDLSPYAAWRPIWRSFFGLDPAASPQSQALMFQQLVADLNPALLSRIPLLAPILGLPLAENELTGSLQSNQRKEALESLLVECIQARLAAADRPLLLVLEDAHWLDPLSRDLLGVIASGTSVLPVMILLASRPAQPEAPEPEPLAGLRSSAVLQLGDLAGTEVADLIAQRVAMAFGPEHSLAEPLAAAISARAEGNPLHAEELINYLHDRGVALDDPQALHDLELPNNLVGLILSRIDQLTVTQQATLKIASLIGRIFPVAWLWGVHPELGSPQEVQRDLEALARLDVTHLFSPDPELHYIFKHATTQEVAYATLPFSQRAALHDQLAAWLEARPETADQLELLAYHYGRGANVAKQREYFRKAGDAAATRYASAAAIDYYERLLEIQAPAEQAATLLEIGRTYVTISNWDRAEQRFQAAIELAAAQGQRATEAQAMLGVGAILRMRAQFDEAKDWLERANAIFIALEDRAGSQSIMLELAWLHFWRNNEPQTRHYAEASLELAKAAPPDPDKIRDAYVLLAHASRLRLDFASDRYWLDRSLELARQMNDRPGIAVALTNTALCAFHQQAFDEAYSLVQEARPIYQELGMRYRYARSSQLLAVIQMVRGNPLESMRIHLQNLELLRALGARSEVVEGLIGVMAAIHRAARTPADLALALRLGAAGTRLSEELVRPFSLALQGWIDSLRADAEATLGPETVAAHWAAGAALSWEEAVELALNARPYSGKRDP